MLKWIYKQSDLYQMSETSELIIVNVSYKYSMFQVKCGLFIRGKGESVMKQQSSESSLVYNSMTFSIDDDCKHRNYIKRMCVSKLLSPIFSIDFRFRKKF